MAQVEQELARQSRAGIPLIDSIGQYICDSGGRGSVPPSFCWALKCADTTDQSGQDLEL